MPVELPLAGSPISVGWSSSDRFERLSSMADTRFAVARG
jgi:hypothetical protein